MEEMRADAHRRLRYRDGDRRHPPPAARQARRAEPDGLPGLEALQIRRPNTAGCKTADEALFTARLARELTGSNWVKLEVIPDPKYLLPDPIATLEAAQTLIADGFVVLPYIHADPVLARRLEEAGCATVMPLGSPIGSGRGIFTLEEIQIIIENAGVPVVVDAGLGAPSDAALALEAGADAVLVNTAIAQAADPVAMGEAFRLGVEAGRKAYLAGRIPAKSSPTRPVPGDLAKPRPRDRPDNGDAPKLAYLSSCS